MPGGNLIVPTGVTTGSRTMYPAGSQITGQDKVQIVNPLPAGTQTWTGQWASTVNYAAVSFGVVSDVAGTIYIDFSMDGDTQDGQASATVPANAYTPLSTGASRAAFMRPRFVKVDANAVQTKFRGQFCLSPTEIEPGSSRVSNGPSTGAVATHVKAFAAALTPAGSTPDSAYLNLDAGGNLRVSRDPYVGGTLAFTTTTGVTTSTIVADQTIVSYTVPAGKTLRLSGADVSAMATGLLGGLLTGTSILNLGTASLVAVAGGVTTRLWTTQLAGQVGASVVSPALPPACVPAGTTVKLVCTPGSTVALRWLGTLAGELV